MREYYSFNSLDNFLKSSVWKQHKNIPRVLYIEKESSHTLFDLETLSLIEKVLFWVQKKFFSKGSTATFFSWRQVIFFHPTIPIPLKEGPIVKTTSVLLELVKILPRQSKESPHLYYYFHPNLGLWQLARVNQTVWSHNFIPHTTETLLENHFEKTRHHMRQLGVKEDIHVIDLFSSLSSSPFLYDRNSTILFQLSSFPSYLHGAFTATILFIGCITYNIFSINTWETQLLSSRQILRQMEEKIRTPTYQRWKHRFQSQRSL